jgi:hypothetical protein
MAATTEELTGQSEQLVNALAFFRTGDKGHSAAHQPFYPNSVERLDHSPEKALKANGHAGQSHAKGAANVGVNLRLKENSEDLDGEFERY